MSASHNLRMMLIVVYKITRRPRLLKLRPEVIAPNLARKSLFLSMIELKFLGVLYWMATKIGKETITEPINTEIRLLNESPEVFHLK